MSSHRRAAAAADTSQFLQHQEKNNLQSTKNYRGAKTEKPIVGMIVSTDRMPQTVDLRDINT